MMKAPSSSALAKNGRNFGSDNSWPSTLVRIYTLQLEMVHDVVEFAHRDLGLLKCHHAEADETVRPPSAIFGDAVIGHAVRGFRDFRVNRVVALAGRGGDDLDVDAHPVEIEQALVDRRHDIGDVLVLQRVDLAGRFVREVR